MVCTLAAAVSQLSALAQPTSAVEAASKTFTAPNFGGKDGNGNTIEQFSDIKVTIIQSPIKPEEVRTRYSMDYAFYNGSGTWRGTQNVKLTFKDANKNTLAQVSFPLDRGRCVYGKAEMRHIEGQIDNILNLIDSVEVDADRLTGVQTGC
jgi:hypothetical protein